jgi:hypothetical protein
MRKRLCSCGCGNKVTPKVESQHLNALAPAHLASQVLDKNRRSIRRKKRSQAIAPFRQLAMGNTGTANVDDIHMDDDDDDDPVSRNSPIMMGEDLDEAYGQ